MPPLFMLVHVALAIGGALLASTLAFNRRAANRWAIVIVLLVLAGLAVERVPDLAWNAMRLGMPSLVFFINQSFAGSIVMLSLLRTMAIDDKARRRATVLGVLLVGMSLWSYAWMYEPVPSG